MGGGLRVPRIIANVEPSDRVGYMTPDPISGDMNRYALLLREEIRTALGGSMRFRFLQVLLRLKLKVLWVGLKPRL